jgi:acyl-coenzyme A thioesterase 9
MICVTGSVESLHLFDKIDINKDLTIEGYLNHVGITSMEIEINVIQEDQLKANSLFTMIARKTADPLQGFPVPGLKFTGLSEEEQKKALARTEAARLNVIQRRKEMSNSYDKKPPTEQEIDEIHKMYLRQKVNNDESLPRTCPIAETVVTVSQVMHTQSRNVHGKIFGGFLIREMIELGWVASCRYAEEMVSIEDLTNIYFKRPVDVGCRLTLKAMVTYVDGDRMVITIEAYTSAMTGKQETLACFMHLVVKSKKDLRNVHPVTYEESLQYLSSRKAFA